MRKLSLLFALFISLNLFAQDAVNYQLPPKDIMDLALAKPTPAVSVDSKGQWMLLIERNMYPLVDELGQPEVRVAGLRINPANFSQSRQNYINNFTLKNIASGKEYKIAGLPANLLANSVSWSPNEKKFAFTNSTGSIVDLYVVDIATQKATKVNKTALNVVLGAAFSWLDDNTLLYKTATKSPAAMPKRPITPKGPTVQESYGSASPRPTFQDMIKSPYDEQLFEFFATSQLVKNVNGVETKINQPAIYSSVSASPDKKYLLVRTINKPFSYVVPANGFNTTVTIHDASGKLVKELAKIPSSETAPGGNDNVADVPRNIEWRDDEAATIVWCKALDGGLIKNTAEFRDAVYALAAPFTAQQKELFKTKMRYGGVTWGNSTFAIVQEMLRSKVIGRMSRWNPSTGEMELLMERSMTDLYNNPGSPVTEKNSYGRDVVIPKDGKLLMNNTTGASPKGDLPFLAYFDLATKKNEIIWRCKEDEYEMVMEVLDRNSLTVLTRKETQTVVPNYHMKTLKGVVPEGGKQITDFKNPYPQLEGVSVEKISYKRADGVDLTGNLYLPKGYNVKKDGPLPVLMWAYPREFTNARDAAQVRGSKNTFTRISWGSPIFWVTQGYAVLDAAEMPIVSTNPDKKPNDDFIDQLKLNARAAIDKLAAMGVGDSTRVGVGGHSYGAFMTAHLLSHTNWFKGGIARSGAYNRTLTPFSFQNEDRTYWQAPQLYFDMSPFSYAQKIKTPILLVHGDTDDNTGTYPIQSERMFQALKGNGGNVRYVSLPYEAHGYRGKENILHLLWEEHMWLEKYVKGKK
ncbi:alpha/beta hydrolase family protein [Lacibacter sediminis]|uniref:Prolyl oligopeptidase family serine peptidase n=1 Tax=Lacibacter sediminis TaxID=2760713 RepID=A0A7G5XBR8_9BACT|nr:prolyl oligopeptidase family serine peptidase [Lacibacter sediminis]QNA42921.1 prolyl oligopeptidase family serine peptidase [Lacibacter sediminis]